MKRANVHKSDAIPNAVFSDACKIDIIARTTNKRFTLMWVWVCVCLRVVCRRQGHSKNVGCCFSIDVRQGYCTVRVHPRSAIETSVEREENREHWIRRHTNHLVHMCICALVTCGCKLGATAGTSTKGDDRTFLWVCARSCYWCCCCTQAISIEKYFVCLLSCWA